MLFDVVCTIEESLIFFLLIESVRFFFKVVSVISQGRIKISIKEPRFDDFDLVIMLSDLRQILAVTRNWKKLLTIKVGNYLSALYGKSDFRQGKRYGIDWLGKYDFPQNELDLAFPCLRRLTFYAKRDLPYIFPA